MTALRIPAWTGLLALAWTAGDARGRESSLAAGLDAPSERAPARGVQSLRPPATGRARIPGGTFEMGSSAREMMDALRLCQSPTRSPLPAKQAVFAAQCDEPEVKNELRTEGQAHEVTLGAFDLDRTEVRVADYARCVAAGRCVAPGFVPGDPRFDRPDYPVTLVRWEDAATYCAWAGGRLPTEAEWEFAARGEERRTFPWGDEYNPHIVNHGSGGGPILTDLDPTDASDGYTYLAPVGSFPDGATPRGILDMAGNVAEWVSDFWGDSDENGYGYSSLSAVDPRGPITGVYHVVRGGSYESAAAWLRAAARSGHILPRTATVGFRCAADANE
jgi:formylglycine-generating enzyme required for sulfatase activity